MSKKILFLILEMGLIGTVLFFSVGQNMISKKDNKNSFSFLKAERGDVVQTVSVSGVVASVQEVDLRFQASGTIKEINYKIGDEVKRGDVLASLNSSDQEIEIKQREAALAQARANLNQKLVGAGIEDIAIYKDRVNNADKIVKTTLNSTQGDIKNSEARVSSAQIILNDAVINLETLEKQNVIDLQIAYEGAQRVINSSLLTIEKTLDDVNDLLRDDDLEDLFSVKNSQYKSESNVAYFQVSESFKAVSDKNKNIGGADYEAIDSLLTGVSSNLTDTQDLLDSVFNGLVSTITSSILSQTTLENHKASVNSLRANINVAIVSMDSSRQKILSLYANHEAKVNGVKSTINTAQATLDLENANLSAIKSRAEAQNILADNSAKLAASELALKIANPRDVDIAYLQAKVYEASASLELARENLKKASIISPVSGVIVDVKFDIGESINSSNDFIRLTTTEKKVEADIPEIEIGKVKIGDGVDMKLDAFENEIFKGKIVSIDPLNTNTQGVIYYKADIVFDDATSSRVVLPGMTADVSILTGHEKNVINLPGSSVKKEGAKFYIQELKDDQLTLRDVEVGLVGDGKIEIINGLKEGDLVVDFVLKTNE